MAVLRSCLLLLRLPDSSGGENLAITWFYLLRLLPGFLFAYGLNCC